MASASVACPSVSLSYSFTPEKSMPKEDSIFDRIASGISTRRPLSAAVGAACPDCSMARRTLLGMFRPAVSIPPPLLDGALSCAVPRFFSTYL